MTPTPAPPRPYPYAPFLLAAIAGVLATIAGDAILIGVATVFPAAVSLGAFALPVNLALHLGVAATTFYLTVDRLLARRGLRALTWPQRWGGLWRGSLLVVMVLPVLVLVGGMVGIPLADARSAGHPLGYDGDARRGAALLVTACLGLVVAPPIFALGAWRRARVDHDDRRPHRGSSAALSPAELPR